MLLNSNPFVPLAWVVVLHLAAWSAGRRMHAGLARWEKRDVSRADSVFHAQLLGFWLLAHVCLLLAFAHLLYAPLLAGIVLALAAESVVHVIRSRRVPRPHPRLADLPALGAVVFWLLFLSEALHPVLGQDDHVYHLFLPKTYLEHHAFVPMTWHINANMPHLTETLYTAALCIGDYTAPKVLAYSFFGLTLLGLWSLTVHRCGRLGAGIVLLVYMSGKDLQSHLGSAHVEPVLGAFLLGALGAVESWRPSSGRPPVLRIALLAGFALATKYTAALFAGPLVAALLLLLWRRARRLPVREAGLLLGVILAMQIPWMVKSAFWVGNPVYPNLSTWFPSEHWSPLQEEHYRLAMRTPNAEAARAGWTWYVAVPYRLTVSDHSFACASASIALMALCLAGLVVAVRRGARMLRAGRSGLDDAYLVLVVWAGLSLWAVTLPQGRYLVAWLPIMAAAAGGTLAPWRNRVRHLLGVLALVGALGAYQVVAQQWPFRLRWDDALTRRTIVAAENRGYELTAYLNRTLPPAGRVLGMWENRFFFLERGFQADSVWQVPDALARLRQRGDSSRYAQMLAAEGITHVVLGASAINTYFGNQFPFSLFDTALYSRDQLAQDKALFERFVREELVPVANVERSMVFELRAARLDS